MEMKTPFKVLKTPKREIGVGRTTFHTASKELCITQNIRR
jgi:hypothetical protein